MRTRWWNQLEPMVLTAWCTALALAGSLLSQWPLRLDALHGYLRALLIVAVLAAFLLVLLRPRRPGFARRLAGYRLRAPRGGAAAFVLLVGAVLVLNYGSLMVLTGLLRPEQVWVPVLEGVLGQPGGAAMLLVLLLFAAPLVEEWLVRGRLQTGIARRWGVPAAIAVSATVFAWLHGIPSLVPVYFVFGLLLGFAVWVTGSVWTGVAIHAAHNGATFGLFLLAQAAGVDAAEAAGAEASAGMLRLGGTALLPGAALLALALRVGGWRRLRRAPGMVWRPLLWLAPLLLVLNLLPAVPG
ncbi:type II CAAX endopeptidase family protein [Aquisalimonas lutea]|uniref:CPBP family intramembrane glutamic endopeptidase n=1 Tax=Aquisalimonas lutea TaxID=1327750 RepID=UPI0025B499CE|nr:type II CAAX endopeptidase family protein [Aquisalimonas lutea]MDN3516778.1 type II CAAX endopeptidase family protein [Aquisalimonas lutea]